MTKQQLNFINYPLIFVCCDLTPLLATKSATEAQCKGILLHCSKATYARNNIKQLPHI